MRISDDAKIALYLKLCGGRPYFPEPFQHRNLQADRTIHLVDVSLPACQDRLEEYRRSRIRT